MCYMLHHVAQEATHKFAFTPPNGGNSLLVFPPSRLLLETVVDVGLGIFDGCNCYGIGNKRTTGNDKSVL